MKGHKRLLEATNDGHYFADCGCGASLGVYRSRTLASAAHTAHVEGREPQGKVRPVIHLTPRAHGASES